MRRSSRIGCVLLAALALLLPTAAAQAAEPPDPRFGIVETTANSQAAAEAGAGYTRIILRWDVIQPGGPADWKPANVPDPVVTAELAAGREVVGLLIGTPAWASADGSETARAVPDMAAWEAFTRRMAQHYAGRINTWVIWNEPDVWMAEHPGKTWDGTEADYALLLKTAYRAIKGVDPSLTVLVAGMTYYWDWEHGRRCYLDRLLEIIAADPEAAAEGYFFDGVVYHLYFNPGQTVDVLEETRASLARYGITGKSIWINETNAPPSDDPQELPWSEPRFSVSLDEQAAFVLQEFALAFSHGAERVEFYKLRNSADHPESIEPFGLLRGDDSPRPAFQAYRTATTHLGGFRSAVHEQRGDINAVTFDRGDETTTVLWTDGTAPLQIRVAAIAAEAMFVDERGNAQPISPVDGLYTVVLPAATCSNAPNCFIGGAPRLLVEQGAANGRTALVESTVSAPEPSTVAERVERPASILWPAWKLLRLE